MPPAPAPPLAPLPPAGHNLCVGVMTAQMFWAWRGADEPGVAAAALAGICIAGTLFCKNLVMQWLIYDNRKAYERIKQ